jgi:hypothetical protein
MQFTLLSVALAIAIERGSALDAAIVAILVVLVGGMLGASIVYRWKSRKHEA